MRVVEGLNLFALSLLLSACGRAVRVTNESTTGFYVNESGGKRMQWGDGQAIPFHFSPDFPPSLRPAVAAAAGTYDSLLSSTRLTLSPSEEGAPAMKGTSVDSVSQDGVNGVYYVRGTWPWPDTDGKHADAMTQLVFSPNGIIEADVFFRASSFSVADAGLVTYVSSHSSASEASLDDLRKSIQSYDVNVQWIYLIAVHEFGHALGRNHSSHEESIMFPTVSLKAISDPFSAYDREVFATAYSLKSE